MSSKLDMYKPFYVYLRKKEQDWAPSTYNRSKHELLLFSNFLSGKKIDLNNLKHHHLVEFSMHLKQTMVSHNSRMSIKKKIKSCLAYLSINKVIKTDYLDLYSKYKCWPKLAFELPQIAQDYLELISTINRNIARNKTYIKRLHHYIKENNIDLKKIKRRDIEGFLREFHKTGVQAGTKKSAVIVLRKYLYWLSDNKHIVTAPDCLISNKDYPQQPIRLPRPLSQDLDIKIQNIFKSENDIFFDSFTLLRNTGLRVSEVINLEFDCIKRDNKNNCLLKVPLGKLNTERLIPISNEMFDLVIKIQNQSKQNAKVKNPKKLIISPLGKKSSYLDFKCRMHEIESELPLNQKASIHQLRHTCATSLLNHGMNIVSLKEFLGHKDIHMTLKYAAITPQTLIKEYNRAIASIQSAYVISKNESDYTEVPLEIEIKDLIKKIKNQTTNENKKRNLSIIRTLKRISP